MQGKKDIWCQMAESDMMFSALKILGKDVVQIRWNNEAHSIVNFNNKIQFNSMGLEWFDKYLRQQPEAWHERYLSDKFNYK